MDFDLVTLNGNVTMDKMLIIGTCILTIWVSTTTAQVRDIGCLSYCQYGRIPGTCDCNPAPSHANRISCMLDCPNNDFVPGKCECRTSARQLEQQGQIVCMLDCGLNGHVPGKCQCKEPANLVQAYPSDACPRTCASYQTCHVVNGRGMCILSLFPGLNQWARQNSGLNPVGNRCHQPRISGSCPGFRKRYYYDSKTKRCVVFRYSGCGANGNNFQTMMECLTTCRGQ